MQLWLAASLSFYASDTSLPGAQQHATRSATRAEVAGLVQTSTETRMPHSGRVWWLLEAPAPATQLLLVQPAQSRPLALAQQPLTLTGIEARSSVRPTVYAAATQQVCVHVV